MTANLTGPRLDPRSGPARQLVVFLHGYGANGDDLIALGEQWRALTPQAAFVAPHAPERCAASPMGRQWFALSDSAPDDPRGEADRWRGAVAARPAIDAFLDAELARLGLDDSRLALVGFSQGAMMALHVGLRRTRAPAAILELFRAAGRSRAPERSQRPRRARQAAADPAGPRRSGSADPGDGDVRGDERPRQCGNPQSMAFVVRRRPRHRRWRPAPWRIVPGQSVRDRGALKGGAEPARPAAGVGKRPRGTRGLRARRLGGTARLTPATGRRRRRRIVAADAPYWQTSTQRRPR